MIDYQDARGVTYVHELNMLNISTSHHGRQWACGRHRKVNYNSFNGNVDLQLQNSPENTKKRQEDTDRSMKYLLETEERKKVGASTVSRKKKQSKVERKQEVWDKKETETVESSGPRSIPGSGRREDTQKGVESQLPLNFG